MTNKRTAHTQVDAIANGKISRLAGRKRIQGKAWLLVLAVALSSLLLLFGSSLMDLIIDRLAGRNDSSVTSVIAFGYIEADNLKAVRSLPRSDLAALKDEYGRTMLMFASFAGNYRIAKYILNHGGIVDKSDLRNNTPLIYATRVGQEKTMKLLIDRGADVNHANSIGVTPLIVACREGGLETVKLLMKHGADPNKPDVDNFTPLMHAVGANKPEIVNLLIDQYGADVNRVSSNGYNALMIAIEQRMIPTAGKLIGKMQYLENKNLNGENVLHMAIRNNLPSIASAILSKDPSLITEPLHGVLPINMPNQTKIMKSVIGLYHRQYKILPEILPATQKIMNVVVNEHHLEHLEQNQTE